MQPVVIFGVGEMAELAFFYFTTEASRKVAAFTVDQEYIKEETFCGLPVIPFAEIEHWWSPTRAEAFVAMGYSNLNMNRTQKVEAFKQKGYQLTSYISTKATIWTDRIGANAFILEDNTIQPFVQIGENVVLWSGNHIGHHSIIENNVFIASHVVISGDVRIGEASFVGVNSTIRDHVSIGKRNIIGAGSIILSTTPDDAIYSPSPTAKSSVPSSRLRRI